MRSATPAETDALIAFASQHFGARILRRRDAPEFILLKEGMEALGIPSSLLDTVLAGRSMTIGSLVYLDDLLTPDDVFEVVPHEMTHVLQEAENGFLKNAWLYAGYTELRAKLEAEAYAVGAAMNYARWKTLPTLDDFRQRIGSGYFLGGAELDLARELFEQAVTGAVRTYDATGETGLKSADVHIEFIRINYPDLLA